MESKDLTRIAAIAGVAYVAGKAIKAAREFSWAAFSLVWIAYWSGGFNWIGDVL